MLYFVAMILLNYSFAFGDGLQNTVVTLAGRSMGAGDKQAVRGFIQEGRRIGFIISLCLSAIYILGAHWYYRLYFSDTASIHQGEQYSYVAAVLTVLQILRIVNIGGMRGIGEVKIPRVLATICVLMINPGTSFLLTELLGYGVWGIWISSLITQVVWCLMSFFYSKKLLS